jgi:hypothetical protein
MGKEDRSFMAVVPCGGAQIRPGKVRAHICCPTSQNSLMNFYDIVFLLKGKK